MLKRRIIAKFLIEDGKLVKYRQFTFDRRTAGNPTTTARLYEDLRVDEMYFCATNVIDPAMIRAVTSEVFTPVTVAGSIYSMRQVDELIQDSGADNVPLPAVNQIVTFHPNDIRKYSININETKCADSILWCLYIMMNPAT